MTQFKAPPIPGGQAQPTMTTPVRPAPRPIPAQPQQPSYAPEAPTYPTQPAGYAPPPQASTQPQTTPYQQPIAYPPADQPAPGTIPTGMDVNTSTEPDDDIYADTIVARVSPNLLKTKTVYGILGGILVVGMILGGMFFGGSSSGNAPQNAAAALGVISNPDIKEHLRRCGQVDKGEACILYIMNHNRYDKIAEDFFDEAVKLMEVQRYSISMVNPKYAKTRIPPGYFVQLKIPNVR